MGKMNTSVTSDNFSELLAKIASTDVTVYEKLNASNDKEAKEGFLANPELRAPRNEYDNLDGVAVAKNLDLLKEVGQALVTLPAESDVSDQEFRLLLALHQDCVCKNVFLLSNWLHQRSLTPKEWTETARLHVAANATLYGLPDRDVFMEFLQERRDAIDPTALSPENRERYRWLIAELGPLSDHQSYSERYQPRPETVTRFGELCRDFFGNLLRHVPDKPELTGEDMATAARAILEEELDCTAYTVVVEPGVSNASVDHIARMVKFSADKVYKRAKAEQILCHELGVHALRAIPYLETPAPENNLKTRVIPAFSTGFPGNETWDEGIAKAVEQGLAGEYTDPGVTHYLNIGLAFFLSKDFRGVYEIRKTLNDLSGKTDKTLLNSVQRCFRGTGELVNCKDLAYYNGAVMVWRYIEQHLDDPDLFDHLFLSGKLNISDPAQERLSYEKRVGNL